MEKKIFLMCCAVLLNGSFCCAQDFEDWIGTWDAKYYYLRAEIQEEREVWTIDNATGDAAYGICTATSSGNEFPIIITWDPEKQLYVYFDIELALEGNAFTGHFINEEDIPVLDDFTVKGTKRPEDGGSEEPGDENCPLILLPGDDETGIVLLRRFRDEKLMRSKKGRTLVKLYYTLGPVVCRTLKEKPELQTLGRNAVLAVLPAIEHML